MVEEDVLKKMEIYGGSFVRQLVVLYRLADPKNKLRIERCFAEYFDKYRKFPDRV